MSLLDRITALTIGRKKEILEYFFALNITSEKIICALWTIEGKHLKILEVSSEQYSTMDDLIPVTDKLLDAVLGIREIDPQKILFGVPSSWLADENLKDEKIKMLRGLVKELELTPMAYVENSHALIHFLEKTEGVPPTAILVEFENYHLTVTVVRAGKLDGVKIVSRGENSGADIEKALLTFSAVETLPSRILIYGIDADQLKNQLLSYPWMSKLSFLHFPKIDTLPEDIEIKSIAFAGASEVDANISYVEKTIVSTAPKSTVVTKDNESLEKEVIKDEVEKEEKPVTPDEKEDLGFIVGDVSVAEASKEKEDLKNDIENDEMASEDLALEDEADKTEPSYTESNIAEVDDFENELEAPSSQTAFAPVESAMAEVSHLNEQIQKKFPFKKFIPRKFRNIAMLGGVIVFIALLLGAFILLPKAEVKIFVEPKILEKDTTVTADPNQKVINEESKIIPGQIVDTEVSGTAKENATGQKEVGNSAKGTVVIYNKTFESKSLSKGTTLSNSAGLKFTLDNSVSIASQSATDSGITFGKSNATITASAVGADSNLPSGSELTVGGLSASQVSAKAEGNFSGGTSKQVTVVSSDDQSKLLASLASSLRQQAQAKLQEKLPQKKVLQEGLLEEIIKKSFSKNINDQATDFSLNLTARYKGTAFEDKDLKSIVSKLVVTQVPEGFKLNLEDTETQADVSKLEKDGKLIFLAKFKAKLMPNIDTEKIKNQIKGKDLNEAINIIKGMENILGADIKVSPSIPLLQRLPILAKNIKVEVGLK